MGRLPEDTPHRASQLAPRRRPEQTGHLKVEGRRAGMSLTAKIVYTGLGLTPISGAIGYFGGLTYGIKFFVWGAVFVTVIFFLDWAIDRSVRAKFRSQRSAAWRNR